MRGILSFLLVTNLAFISPGLSQDNEINLMGFETDNGQCTVSEKDDLYRQAIKENISPFSSFTISEAPIDSHRGFSPPTGAVIDPLETVACLKRDGDKMLVTSLDPLASSCGWINVKNLQPVTSTGLIASTLKPCGKVKAMTVGTICDTIAKFNPLSRNAKKLTRFCNIEGVNSSTIDAKFVTDNTTSRLTNLSQDNAELVKREIPLYLEPEGDKVHDLLTIFSMSEIYDIAQKQSGDLRILLGIDGKVKGWAELDTGHIWYSNLSTYFSPNGSKDVYLENIIGGQSDSGRVLAEKPSPSSFNVNREYVKFPILFDKRRKTEKSPSSHVPQLQIAFIGKLCDGGNGNGSKMCTENDNMYTQSLSNLRSADVVFLIDGSKSMKKYFAYVAESLSKFTSGYIGNPDYRFGVAIYGDYLSKNFTNIGDPIDFKVVRDLKPVISSNFENIENTALLPNDALKDKPEAVHAAVFTAAQSFLWAQDKPHYIIHIADHGDRKYPTEKVFRELSKNNIFYIPIAVEGEEIRRESDDFIKQAGTYFKKYLTDNGNPMAANVIKSYGQGNQRAEDAIDTALVTATNTISIVEDNDQGSILPTLSAAVRDIFNIPEADDIETIAAVGNIETAPINATENNWNYFVALNSIEMGDLELQAKQLCELLETGGDQTSLAERAILSIVKILTGDQKSDTELAQQIMERAIPLQTRTIIGDGMADFILATQTGKNLGVYKREFCRTQLLLGSMLREDIRLLNPYENQDLIWDEDLYILASDGVDFEWQYEDELGQIIYYLPIEYLPQPVDRP